MEYLNIVFQEVYKILFLLVPVLVSVAMIVWLDRRVWAFVQKRQGPNVVAKSSKTMIECNNAKMNLKSTGTEG